MASEPAEYISKKILEEVFNELSNESRNKIIKMIRHLTKHLREDNIFSIIHDLFDETVKHKNIELAEYIIDDLYDYYDLYNIINIVVQHNSVECLKMIIFDSYYLNYRNLREVESYNCDTPPETLKYFLALGYWKHSVVTKKLRNIFI